MRRPSSPSGVTVHLGAEIGAASSRCGRAWPRVSITVVRPGALRPASSTADLICAEATGVRSRSARGSAAPRSVMRQRPPSACDEHLRAHLRQRIEDAAHRPLAQRGVAIEGRGDRRGRRRRPSSAASRCRHCRNRARRPARETADADAADAPRAVAACARRPRPARGRPRPVRSTSSPSSRPSTSVSPTRSRPKIMARCEIDLSPGTRARPLSGPAGGRKAAGPRHEQWTSDCPRASARHANPGRAALAQGWTRRHPAPVVRPENASPHPREANGRPLLHTSRRTHRNLAFDSRRAARLTGSLPISNRTRLAPWPNRNSAPSANARAAARSSTT